jgi:nucleoid DNA-binding protein
MSEVIGKTVIVKEVAEATGTSKNLVDEVVDEVLDCVYNHIVSGDTVRLPGIGSLKIKTLAARKFVNPQGNTVMKGERKSVKYSPSKTIVEAVNE